MAAKIHLAASMQHLPYACEFTELSLLRASILSPKVELVNGCVKVPDGAGFGFGLDEGVLKSYSLDLTGRKE